MKRGTTGRYEVSTTAGEAVRAFVPSPLPPLPPLDLAGSRQRMLEQALLACGRLDGVSALLPDPDLFLYGYVRREAVLSSQIERTQSSLSDLLLFELDEKHPACRSTMSSKFRIMLLPWITAWRACNPVFHFRTVCCARCTPSFSRAVAVPTSSPENFATLKIGSAARGRAMRISCRRRRPSSRTAWRNSSASSTTARTLCPIW